MRQLPVRQSPPAVRPWTLPWLGRQLLLVPEAVVLLVVLAMHQPLGYPLWTALVGIGATAIFIARVVLLGLAARAMRRGRYPRAAALASLALVVYPWSADAYRLLAGIRVAQGSMPQAIDALARAIALFPGHARLHAALAGLLLDHGELVDAAHHARLACELDRGSAVALLALAQVAEAQGMHANAEMLLRDALVKPMAAAERAAIQLMRVRCLLVLGRAAEALLALQGLEPLLQSTPAPLQAELRYMLGELLIQLGRGDEARAQFRGVELVDPHGRYAQAAWRAARI